MRLIKLQFVSRINHLHNCCIFVNHFLLWNAEANQKNKKNSLNLHFKINKLRTMSLHFYIFKNSKDFSAVLKASSFHKLLTGPTLKLRLDLKGSSWTSMAGLIDHSFCWPCLKALSTFRLAILAIFCKMQSKLQASLPHGRLNWLEATQRQLGYYLSMRQNVTNHLCV